MRGKEKGGKEEERKGEGGGREGEERRNKGRKERGRKVLRMDTSERHNRGIIRLLSLSIFVCVLCMYKIFIGELLSLLLQIH